MRQLKIKTRPTEEQKEKAKANKKFTQEELKEKFPMVKKKVSPKETFKAVDNTKYKVLPVEKKTVVKPSSTKTTTAAVVKPKATAAQPIPKEKVLVNKEKTVVVPKKERKFVKRKIKGVWQTVLE